MQKKSTVTQPLQPLIRFRSMLIGVVLLVLLIAGPLLIVSKQVYITDTSRHMSKMSDSLNILDKEIATLRLTCERLSSNSRIEQFAREAKQLEYPNSNQIVIVKIGRGQNRSSIGEALNFVSFVKKALGVRS